MQNCVIHIDPIRLFLLLYRYSPHNNVFECRTCNSFHEYIFWRVHRKFCDGARVLTCSVGEIPVVFFAPGNLNLWTRFCRCRQSFVNARASRDNILSNLRGHSRDKILPLTFMNRFHHTTLTGGNLKSDTPSNKTPNQASSTKKRVVGSSHKGGTMKSYSLWLRMGTVNDHFFAATPNSRI